MTKISQRAVRTLRREVAKNSRMLAQTHRNVICCLDKASIDHKAYVSLLTSQENANQQLRQNIVSFQKLFTKQQRIIREQRSRLQHLQHVCNKREDEQKAMERETTEVAVAMVAMSQQCCRTCLGSGSVQKTKKNIRYNVECKQCK